MSSEDLNDLIFMMNNTYIDIELSEMVSYIDTANIDITIKNHLKYLIYRDSYVTYDMINMFINQADENG